MAIQDDPVKEYLRLYGKGGQPQSPAPAALDPVAEYQQTYGTPAQTALSPDQERVHARRRGFGKAPSALSEYGGIAKDVVHDFVEFGKESVKLAGRGYRSAYDLGRGDTSRLQETEEQAHAYAKGLVTFPYHAVKETRDVTQRALAGEDVSPREIGHAWSTGAMGVAVPVGMARGAVSRVRSRGRRTAPPAQPVSTSPTPTQVSGLADIARARVAGTRPAPLEELTLTDEFAAPPEVQSAPRAVNPLSYIDDAIAAGRERLAQLEAERAGRTVEERAALIAQANKQPLDLIEPSTPEQAAPDALRTLSDAELEAQPGGKTPPLEQSAEATMEQRILETMQRPGALDRMEASERRLGQQPFEGAERRVPDEARLQALLDEASQRLTARQGRPLASLAERPDLEGFMGTGPESMTPEAVARTEIIGRQPPKPPRKPLQRSLEQAEREAFPDEAAGETPGPQLSDAEREALYPEHTTPAMRAAMERAQREPPDVRTPGTYGGEQPPIPPKKPIERADLSALDARLAAEQAENARLQAREAELPFKSPTAARRERIAAQTSEGQQAHRDALRKKLPSRREYQREVRSLQATIRMMEKRLQRYPESDARPHAVEVRNEALHILRAAQERLAEVTALKEGTPYKRPPLKGPKGTMGPGLGEKGTVPLGPILPQRAAPRTAAEAHLDSKIGTGATADPVSMSTRMHEFIQNFTESAHIARVAKRIVQKASRAVPIVQDAALWMKAHLDAPKRIAQAIFGEGPGYFDDFGKWRFLDSPGLDAILKPIRKHGDIQAVRRLMISQRAPEYAAQGFKSGIDAAKAAEIVRRATPRQLKAATELRNWLNQTIEGAIESGALSRELFDIWQKKYPHYVDYHVVFPGEGAVSRVGSGATNVRPPAHAVRTGSELPKIDPFESIPDQGARWIRYTTMHRAVKSTLDLLDANRDVLGDLVTKVSSKPVQRATALSEIGELLTDKALRLEGDQVRIYNAKTNAVEVWKLDPAVADGLRALGSKEWNFALELLAAGKKGVQWGVTSGPLWGTIFGIVNFIRDNLGRPTMSQATRYPFEGALSTIIREAIGKQKPELKAYKSMGGGFGQAQESSGAFSHLRRSIPGRSRLRAEQGERQYMAQRLTGESPIHTKVIRSINEFLQSGSVPFEEASRGAEFQAQKRLGLSDLEAYINSQEVLGNFAERPTSGWVRAFMHVTPFLNPRVQGTRAAWESLGKKRIGKTALKWTMTIGLPTLALYAINYDDEEIQELRTGPGGYNSFYLRPSNFHPSLSDEIIRIPSPFAPGAGAHALEHGWDMLRGVDEHGLRRALRDVGSELFETSINPLVGVPVALGRNKAIGTGVPIVPEAEQDRVPEDQLGSHPNFSLQRVSQALPEGARFSPAKAQYAAGQLFGTVGREGLNLTDMLTQADKLPARRGWSDNPITSRFFARYPTTAAGSVRDVYSEARHPMAALNTLRDLAAKGDAAGVLRTLEEHGDELAGGAAGEELTGTLSQVTNLARQLEYAPYLSPEDRRNLRDDMLRLTIELARQFHPIMHDLRP